MPVVVHDVPAAPALRGEAHLVPRRSDADSPADDPCLRELRQDVDAPLSDAPCHLALGASADGAVIAVIALPPSTSTAP
jgi:hypothetical protein